MMTLNLYVGLLFGVIGIAFPFKRSGCVDEVLEPCPPFFVALASLGEPFADAECSSRVALVLEGEISIRAPYKKGGSGEDYVELGIDGTMRLECNGPDDDNDDGYGDFHQ